MTSTAAYLLTLDLLRKSAVGDWPIDVWERVVNAEQVDFFRENLPAKGDMRGQNRLSAFLSRRVVALTDGVGTYNPGGNTLGDLLSGPICYVPKFPLQECDKPPVGDPMFVTVPVLDVEEFDSITTDTIDGPTIRKPKAMLLNDRDIYVLPRKIRYIHCWYWRKPRAMAVGIDPGSQLPKLRPLEGGPGQVDSEWNTDDLLLIIYNALAKAGVPLQADRLVQAGTMMGRDK